MKVSRFLFALLSFSIFSIPLLSQSEVRLDGIYGSKNNYTLNTLSNNMEVGKGYISKKAKKTFGDDVLLFYYKLNKQNISNVFAIVEEGKTYLNAQYLGSKVQDKGIARRMLQADIFYPAERIGKWMLIKLYIPPNYEAMAIGGGFFGLVGLAAGAAMSKKKLHSPLIYNFETDEAFIFEKCIDYQNFIRSIDDEALLECKNKVIELFPQINDIFHNLSNE